MTTVTANRCPASAREAAAYYRARGWTPVPVPYRLKKPVLPGWPELRAATLDLDGLFPPGEFSNIGLLTGEASGNLLDADLDCPQAIAAASVLLPATGMVAGRPGAPRSHCFYKTDLLPEKAAVSFYDVVKDPDAEHGAKLLELRGSRSQSLVPPSVHPDGEEYAWHDSGNPTFVRLPELLTAIWEVASASLIARHWAKGSRHDSAKALAGALLRAGWSQDRVHKFLRAVATAAGDEELADRARTVADTAEKLDRDKQTTGWPSLAKELGSHGAAVVDRVRDWLGITPVKLNLGRPARPRPLPPWGPFPLGALPPVLSELVPTAARGIGCDPALVVLPALAVVAGCIGNRRAVLLKKGWVEPAIIWSLTVAESGGHKSPAYDAAVDPLTDLQMDLYDRHQLDREEYERAVDGWQALSRDERGQKPAEPETYVTGDATIEALGDLLQNSPGGVLLARDELDAWFKSFTRYKGKGGGSDRPQWLELHRAGTLRVDRLTRERRRVAVRRAAVSITGTIQPAVLAQALDLDALQAGLGARFLLAMPPRRRRVWTEDELPEELVGRYQALLRSLLDLPLADEGRRRPHVLGLSPAARRLWVEFYNEWGAVQFDAEGEQAAAFAKIEAYASRLSLLHHVVSHVAAGADDCCSVTETSVRAGIELARWFAAEALRVYAVLRETHEERQARKLVEWVTERGGRVTVKQLQQSNHRRWPTSDLAEAALEELVKAGLGRWEDGPRPERGGKRLRFFVLLSDDSDDRPAGQRGPDEDPPDDRPDDRPTAPPSPSGETDGSPLSGESSKPWIVKAWGRSSESSDGPSAFRPGGKGASSDGVGERSSDAKVAKSTRCALIADSAELALVFQALDGSGRVGLDIETTGLNPHADRMRLLSLATSRGAFLIDCFAVDPRPLFGKLAEKVMVGHNLYFDLGFLAVRGFELGPVRDTLLLSRLLYGTRQPRGFHDLQKCAERELGQSLDKTKQRSCWAGTLDQAQLDYAATDAAVTLSLCEALDAKVREAGLTAVADIESRCLPAMVWLARSGVGVSRDSWLALSVQADAEAQQLAGELDALAPAPDQPGFFSGWNWDSPEQVKEVFHRLGVELVKTDDETLAAVEHPLADLLRRYRVSRKGCTTYGPDWLKHVAADGRVYASWNQLGSDVGRMSCSRPNLQQLPRGAHRRCIQAPLDRVLVKADYSQIELRIAAEIAGEKAMLDAYARGEDLHQLTAQRVLGVADVTKEQRQLAKAVNFGLLYGMRAKGLRKYARSQYGLELTEREAWNYRRAFFKSYPGLAAWHQRVEREHAAETRTLAGRRRLIAAEWSDTLRLNSPIQGTGADGLKLALAFLWERREECPGAFPVLAVHDEIVVECAANQAEGASGWLRQAMLDGMQPWLKQVPVEVEVRAGRTWGGDQTAAPA